MPNCCSTVVAIMARKENEVAVKRLKVLREILANGPEAVRGNSSKNWIGNYLIQLGIDPDAFPCRSFIQDVSDGLDWSKGFYFFKLYTEDAWHPAYEAWDAMMNAPACEGLSYVLEAEEPGGNLYVNTDRDGIAFIEAYRLDFVGYDNRAQRFNSDVLYFEDLESYLQAVKSIFGVEAKTFKESREKLNTLWEENPERFELISIGEFTE